MKSVRIGLCVAILSITSVIIAGELNLPDGIKHIDTRRAVKKYNDRMANLDATYNKSWQQVRGDLVQELNQLALELSQRNDPKILDQILSIREFSNQVQQMPGPLENR